MNRATLATLVVSIFILVSEVVIAGTPECKNACISAGYSDGKCLSPYCSGEYTGGDASMDIHCSQGTYCCCKVGGVTTTTTTVKSVVTTTTIKSTTTTLASGCPNYKQYKDCVSCLSAGKGCRWCQGGVWGSGCGDSCGDLSCPFGKCYAPGDICPGATTTTTTTVPGQTTTTTTLPIGNVKACLNAPSEVKVGESVTIDATCSQFACTGDDRQISWQVEFPLGNCLICDQRDNRYYSFSGNTVKQFAFQKEGTAKVSIIVRCRIYEKTDQVTRNIIIKSGEIPSNQSSCSIITQEVAHPNSVEHRLIVSFSNLPDNYVGRTNSLYVDCGSGSSAGYSCYLNAKSSSCGYYENGAQCTYYREGEYTIRVTLNNDITCSRKITAKFGGGNKTCADYTNCFECAVDTNCGWCNTTSRCMSWSECRNTCTNCISDSSRCPISPVQCPLKLENTKAYPSPASTQITFEAEGQGIEEIRVLVYDLSGNNRFDSGWQKGNKYTWNLKDKDGKDVASGTYSYTIMVRGCNDSKTGTTKNFVVQRGAKAWSFTWSPSEPVANQKVTFTSDQKQCDVLGDTRVYNWFINEKNVKTGKNDQVMEYTFDAAGTYTVKLVRWCDRLGQKFEIDSLEKQITIRETGATTTTLQPGITTTTTLSPESCENALERAGNTACAYDFNKNFRIEADELTIAIGDWINTGHPNDQEIFGLRTLQERQCDTSSKCGQPPASTTTSTTTTTTIPSGSCRGRCGQYTQGAPCQCDSSCRTYRDCCDDVCNACPDLLFCAVTTTTLITPTTLPVTTTTIPSGQFTSTGFACVPILGGHRCTLSYNNQLGENAIVLFLYTDSKGRVISAPAPVGHQGPDSVASALYCNTVQPGSYKIFWKAYRESDQSLSRELAWSKTYETQTVVC